MKKAVGHLIPFMEKEREETKLLTGTVEEEASQFANPGGFCEELGRTNLEDSPWVESRIGLFYCLYMLKKMK